MGCLKWLFIFLSFVLLCSEVAFSSKLSSESTSSRQPLCRLDQRSALLQLKGELPVITPSKSVAIPRCDPYYPKTRSWQSNDTNCCLWDGVTCDRATGYVIELDLYCSMLSGTIHPNSSIFQLTHLQRLNLAFNEFSHSQIPQAIGSFKDLTHLNLADSHLSGPVPSEICFLSKLVSLNLSSNNLTLEAHNFKSLLKNLTRLEELALNDVNVSSTLPDLITNLSSLTTINLGSTGLRGYIPSHIFFLPHLKTLDLGGNGDLKGVFPQGNWTSNVFLTYLELKNTGFIGEIPDSFGNLKSLSTLHLSNCNFSGSIPESIGNLTEMTVVSISGNKFIGSIPNTLSSLRKLIYLDLSSNNLTGIIPDGLLKLEDLRELYMSDNALTGPLPSNASGLQNLENLSLSNNLLNGLLPPWLFSLPSLTDLDISSNRLTGVIHDFNSKSVLNSINLGNNYLQGPIPDSVVNLTSLNFLDLSHNYLNGPIPALPINMWFVFLSQNNFTGGMDISICSLEELFILVVALNDLSGTIPECLGNSSSYLETLDLQKNRFCGVIPSNFSKALKTLNLNGNHFEGSIPISLGECKGLEVLDLGNNRLTGTFPHWLESLPYLKVIVFCLNEFYGHIEPTRSEAPFPLLQVFDVSNNKFTGHLPASFFRAFAAMRNLSEDGIQDMYMDDNSLYRNSIKLDWKGSKVQFVRILRALTAIDLSSNKFEGEIPDVISILDGLRSLNLSHNYLRGHILASLGNLTKLESLDLSHNELTGEIPQTLTRLTSLGTLKLSKNHLVGRIPYGNQLKAFPEDAYGENPGLCGLPLSKVCERGKPSFQQEKEEGSSIFDGFTWQVVMLGYGCGTIIGFVMGSLMLHLGRPRWFLSVFEEGKKILDYLVRIFK